jgi:hypothetical protein
MGLEFVLVFVLRVSSWKIQLNVANSCARPAMQNRLPVIVLLDALETPKRLAAMEFAGISASNQSVCTQIIRQIFVSHLVLAHPIISQTLCLATASAGVLMGTSHKHLAEPALNTALLGLQTISPEAVWVCAPLELSKPMLIRQLVLA